MLAHRKSKSLTSSKSISNNKDKSPYVLPPPRDEKISIKNESTSTTKPSLISPSSSSKNVVGGVEVSNSSRKRVSFVPKKEADARAPDQSDILDSLIPGLKDNLFSKEAGNVQKTKELKRLLQCLGDLGSISDKVLLKLVDCLKQNVEGLDDKMAPLVSPVVESNWYCRSPKVVKAFEEFISELVVIKPSYVNLVLQSFVRKFLPQGIQEENYQHPDIIGEKDAKVFEIVHRSVKKVLEAYPIPRTRDSFVKTMGNVYPYMGKRAYFHYCFVKNVIETTTYVPQIGMQVMHLIFHKLCRIDVNVPRDHSEVLDELISSSSYFRGELKDESGSMMPISLDTSEVINSIIFESSATGDGEEDEVNPLVNILDLCLNLVFEWIEDYLKTNCEEEERLNLLYSSLLSTFETEVLPTFGVNHVQFIYFYVVCREQEFTKLFLETLWRKVVSVNTPDVIRMQCMSYIGGVLARASVVSVKVLKRWLSRMADWANSYVDQKVKSSHWSCVNIQMHGAFYAVCQAIFYVFAFRNKDLVGSRKCTAFTGTLNLGRLVTCDLNPLKTISPEVAEAFVKAAHVHQISYCQTVLERNQRATIPTKAGNSVQATDLPAVNILEGFFPFDPFLLPRSRKWIDPTYRVYEPYLPEVKIEKSDSSCRSSPSSNRPSDNDNEDSIDMDLSTSYQDRDRNYFMVRLMNSSREDYDNMMDVEMQ